MRSFDAIGDPFERQRFRAGDGDGRVEQGNRQRPGSPAGMPAQQPGNAQRFPGVPPVVERLVTDAQFFRNRRGMLPGAQHQQPRRPRTRVSPRVIDRQLYQGHGFAFRQGQFYLHRRLRE